VSVIAFESAGFGDDVSARACTRSRLAAAAVTSEVHDRTCGLPRAAARRCGHRRSTPAGHGQTRVARHVRLL